MNKVSESTTVKCFSFFLSFFSVVHFPPFFPGSSFGNFVILTRWDVSSNPGNWDFSSLKNKNKIKMPNKWRTIESLD